MGYDGPSDHDSPDFDESSQSSAQRAASAIADATSSRNSPGQFSGQFSGQFRLPGWAKAALLLAVIALSSVGYFAHSPDSLNHLGLPFTQGAAPNQPSTVMVDADEEDAATRAPVRDFILTDAEGKQKRLSDYRGSVVILSFWASWCTPCLVELPTFGEIERKLHEKGLHVLAVNVDEGDEGKTFAKDFWAKNKFQFPSFFDSGKTIAQQFEVEALPSNFVIDRQGRMAFSGFGANDWSNPETIDFIGQLLDEPATAQNP